MVLKSNVCKQTFFHRGAHQTVIHNVANIFDIAVSAVLLIQLLGLLQQPQHRILFKELPTGFLLWPLRHLCCGQDFWFPQAEAWTSLPPTRLISPAPAAEPRRADGAMNPKKRLRKTRRRDKAPAAKGQPISC